VTSVQSRRRRPDEVLVARLLKRTNKTEACWLWIGPLKSDGYAYTWDGRRHQLVHRLAHELWIGPIAEGLQVDHLCKTRNCLNPKHLEAVTPLVNVRRSSSACAAKTHCPQGHPYDEANTYRPRLARGVAARVCKKCSADRQRRARAAKRATSGEAVK
jgi:hypothetical protein